MRSRKLQFCKPTLVVSSKFLSVNLKLQGVISIGRVLPLTCQFNASPRANCWKVNLCFEMDLRSDWVEDGETDLFLLPPNGRREILHNDAAGKQSPNRLLYLWVEIFFLPNLSKTNYFTRAQISAMNTASLVAFSLSSLKKTNNSFPLR